MSLSFAWKRKFESRKIFNEPSNTHPKLFQLRQHVDVLDLFYTILSHVQRLDFAILLQVLELLNPVLGQIELGEVDEALEIFNFGQTIVLEAKALQVDKFLKILNFCDFVLPHVEMSEAGEAIEFFDLLK